MKALQKIRHYFLNLGIAGTGVFIVSKIFGRRPLFKTRVAGAREPVFVRIGTTDISVLAQVLNERHYELPFEMRPKVIIDAGANIGLSAVYFANRYPDARIFAIEPEASNFAVLEKNVAAYPQIKALNAALWREKGKINLVDPDCGHHGFQTSATKQGTKAVEAMTVDGLMDQFGLEFIDILKIDIEGAELEVFQTSGVWIGKVGMVMAELHDNLKSGCTAAFTQATKDFTEQVEKGEILMRYRKGVCGAAAQG